MRLHEIENRYAFAPVPFRREISSAVRLYESQATSPEDPSAILPGILQNVSQIDGPRPSAVGAPSIW